MPLEGKLKKIQKKRYEPDTSINKIEILRDHLYGYSSRPQHIFADVQLVNNAINIQDEQPITLDEESTSSVLFRETNNNIYFNTLMNEERKSKKRKSKKRRWKITPPLRDNLTIYDDSGLWTIRIQANGKVLFNRKKSTFQHSMDFWNYVKFEGQNLYERLSENEKINKLLLKENDDLKEEIERLKQKLNPQNSNSNDENTNKINTISDSFDVKESLELKPSNE